MKQLFLLLAFLLACQHIYAADASERKFISTGMSEAQVIYKIGKPDNKTSSGKKSVKQWVYFPTTDESGENQTITLIEFYKGKVVKVERNISR